MACLDVSRCGVSPTVGCRPFTACRRRSPPPYSLRLRCRLEDQSDESNGEEQRPETLFMKELRRRGMTPTSLLEESARETYGSVEGAKEEGGGSRGKKKKNGVAEADFEKALANQRERSMALNSEGLEGLIPRAKLLLTIGGTFFVGFWPLIVVTISCFAALYYLFGTGFMHDASKMSVSLPTYIDPYALLEDERLSRVSPSLE